MNPFSKPSYLFHENPLQRLTKYSLLVTGLFASMLLLPISISAQEFQSLGAQNAQRKYNTALDKYKLEVEKLDAQKALAEETYKKELQTALTNATKAGNLEEALKIKQFLEGDEPEANKKPDDNKKNADAKII
jgi:hypothetical protein